MCVAQDFQQAPQAAGRAAQDFERSIAALEAQRDVAALVRGLRQHLDHAGVQQAGCAALSNLTAVDNANAADNRKAIAAEGGIGAVVAGMRGHPASAGVQEQGSWALLNIGWSDQDVQGQIKTAGAAEVVTRAMAAPNATAKTKEKGQQLLDRLSRV